MTISERKTVESPVVDAESAAHTHEVFNQARPLENYNMFASDTALSEAVKRHGGEASLPDLAAYGVRCGSSEVIGWGFDANEFKPQFDSHDRYGNRADQVRFHPAYHELMAMGLKQGIHALPWEGNTRSANVVRAAYSYMQTQVEPGHGCPLTMTFAAVPTIRLTPSVAKEWLPRILARDYQPENKLWQQKSAVTIGMGMTEKQGGSDVRANTTRAVAIEGRGPGARYELTGHKWFMSAPMCDAFLVLAQAEGGLSCFLVPRWRSDETKNAVFVQRLKNKMGNCSNASSEVEFRGAEGWMLGEEGRGVPAIIEMVSLTRFDCMVGSSALQRQAVVQAVHHARHREAFGKRLIDQPLMRNVLADLQLESEASLAMTMRMAAALDQPDNHDESLLLRLGLPIGKYWICKRTPGLTYEAMECLGGNGVIETSILPRLYREAPVNAIWEGSGNVQALDVMRAMMKSPEAVSCWLAEVEKACGQFAELDQLIGQIKQRLSKPENLEFEARILLEEMALCFQAATLLQYGDSKVAEAYMLSRFQGRHSLYGNLPASIDVDAILSRALPEVY
ncbi:acyl-CoA dehydrogenase family protein [Spongiibacter sp. KMU-158]|uniref:Acyl-CoA dehydrogenase family protein n=1 Tax=Spongiibacter pelagi TaxID=2760804 RepID=A0A927C3N2_9GAMM|nr:acyl-CoA dehydrogenase family protein [Spongiibacter pelagi]MBD2859176.1 acyl-CoA dehydrogenase family protein [Spongiibacter pelagi]